MTDTPAPTTPTGWHVTSQTETTEATPAGTFVNGWRIYFSTTGGHDGSVFVPKAQYAPAFVRQAIAAAAANIDAIGQLSS